MKHNTTRRFLVTSALPYANGPLHFGHLAGVYIPADIYSRHRKLQGHVVKHISGSDEHGVAIMVAAEKEGIAYQPYVDRWHENHKALFNKYDIAFDFFGRTSSGYHKDEVLRWFHLLNERKYIEKKTEKQLYCIDDKRFLPDRYVEGTCYNCAYAHARGDECPNCGEWIDPIRLINPVSKMSGSKNIEIREVDQYYLSLTKLEPRFRDWYKTKSHWRNLVTGFIDGILEKGLIDRAITRDLDWGIDVPLAEAAGKKLYVWFDAPIGYVSNLKQHLEETQSPEHYLRDWWDADGVEISHFIGKDNIIFHALIWPSMIIGTGLIRLPTEIPANHFLNLDGKQFSKSAGWYVDAEKALEEFGPDALRLYLCSLTPENGDSSFTWDGFASAQGEIGNKIGNFLHRSLTFIEKHWPDGLPPSATAGLEAHPQLDIASQHHRKISDALDRFEFNKALSELILMSQAANEFFHSEAPWKQIKDNRGATEKTLAVAVFYIAAMGTLLQPFAPSLSAAILAHFSGILDSNDIKLAYLGDFRHLARRFASGYKSPIPAKVLLPRVDPLKIKKFKDDLTKHPA